MLKINNLSVKFPRFTLNNICLNVSRGEYFILFGPTGSGKTVIFELIAGLRRPLTGTVIINGHDRTWADPAYRKIGYVPQDLALIPFKTVWQNLAFGLYSAPFRPADNGLNPGQAIRQRVDEMLSILKIEHLADRLPAHLSGGEKQRVALGRALAVRPDVLLLDEPLSAVDELTGNSLMREIKALQQRFAITTVHICHRFEEMYFLADQVAVLRDGSMVQTGTPDQICSNPGNDFVADLMRVKKNH